MPKVKEETTINPRTRAQRPFPLPRLSEDVISFSECRNNLAACQKRVGETHRLIFITPNGRPTSFIGNIAELDAGQGIPHRELKRQIEAEGESMRKELGL